MAADAAGERRGDTPRKAVNSEKKLLTSWPATGHSTSLKLRHVNA
jgi:hypothetical protein